MEAFQIETSLGRLTEGNVFSLLKRDQLRELAKVYGIKRGRDKTDTIRNLSKAGLDHIKVKIFIGDK